MNKTIKRRNLDHLSRMYDVDPRRHVGEARRIQHEKAVAKWWDRFTKSEALHVGLSFKMWSRQAKKEWLSAGTNAYDKWKARYDKHTKTDPNMSLIVGRHVLAPVDVCWSKDRRFKGSLVKANAQGRRRKF